MTTNTSPSSRHKLSDRIFGPLVRAIRLNAVRVETTQVFKRRNPFGRHIMPAANWFFRWCKVPISFWTDVHAWQRWEISCYRMLHPQFHARTAGDDGVCEDRLPGDSLWTHLRNKTLTIDMLSAAGKEFRRAHGMTSEVYGGPWSHGDGAMCNMLYDPWSGRARLIDFELVHNVSLPAEIRQADDLSAFLLDLAGFTTGQEWVPFALAFLRAYTDGSAEKVIDALRARLVVPNGRYRFWWKIRSNFVATIKIKHRLLRLGRALDHGALGGAVDTSASAGRVVRGVQSRLPSVHCQATSPGMP